MGGHSAPKTVRLELCTVAHHHCMVKQHLTVKNEPPAWRLQSLAMAEAAVIPMLASASGKEPAVSLSRTLML